MFLAVHPHVVFIFLSLSLHQSLHFPSYIAGKSSKNYESIQKGNVLLALLGTALDGPCHHDVVFRDSYFNQYVSLVKILCSSMHNE